MRQMLADPEPWTPTHASDTLVTIIGDTNTRKNRDAPYEELSPVLPIGKIPHRVDFTRDRDQSRKDDCGPGDAARRRRSRPSLHGAPGVSPALSDRDPGSQE